MVRKQLCLDESLESRLASRARELGVSQAEVVREALERYLSESAQERRSKAWREAREVMLGIAAKGAPRQPRKWTREDAHDR